MQRSHLQRLDKRGARGAMAPPEFSGSSTNIAFGPSGIFRITLIFTNFPKVAPPEFQALSRHWYGVLFWKSTYLPKNQTSGFEKPTYLPTKISDVIYGCPLSHLSNGSWSANMQALKVKIYWMNSTANFVWFQFIVSLVLFQFCWILTYLRFDWEESKYKLYLKFKKRTRVILGRKGLVIQS